MVYIYLQGKGLLSATSSSNGKYKITDYTKNRAKDLGVKVEPSKRDDKKIDVIEKDGDVVSVGGVRKDGSYYMDFPNYIKEYGRKRAEEFRKKYKKRHEKDRHKKGTAGYYSDQLLW